MKKLLALLLLTALMISGCAHKTDVDDLQWKLKGLERRVEYLEYMDGGTDDWINRHMESCHAGSMCDLAEESVKETNKIFNERERNLFK